MLSYAVANLTRTTVTLNMKTRSKSVPCKDSKGGTDVNNNSSSSSADPTSSVNEENTKTVIITGSNTAESIETNSGNGILSQ